MNNTIKTLLTLAVLSLSSTAQAVPITYDIGPGSGPNFSASWVHAGTGQIGSTGYFANGTKTAITGFLTMDMDNLAAANGSLSGLGDFGAWAIDITGGGSSVVPTFTGGLSLLLSLDYTATSDNGTSTGTFYFANKDFSASPADGPNIITGNNLYLWGNNWINASGGSIDKDAFVNAGNYALGLDLFGTARDVPEPSILALLVMGLIGLLMTGRNKRA